MTTPPATRRSIFAVWHWPRWVWGVVLPMLAVCYLASRAPVAFALFSAGVFRDPHVNRVYQTVYSPHYALEDRCQPFQDLFVWEWNQLAGWFGDPR